jgi:hypothetical protein
LSACLFVCLIVELFVSVFDCWLVCFIVWLLQDGKQIRSGWGCESVRS